MLALRRHSHGEPLDRRSLVARRFKRRDDLEWLHEDGRSTCRLYTVYRLPNCCTFPIDARDLADRDLVAPDIPCGYFWPEVATRSARGS